VNEDEAYRELLGDDPARVARAEAALWETWTHSDRPEVDRLLRDGVAAMERQDFPRAEELFAHVIEIAPDFAEGWNKRATVRYLNEDFAGAIADCVETITRKPRHFGALSGQGLCHMALGQHREAAELFRRCLEVHPSLVAARRNLAVALGEAVRLNGHQKRPNTSASSS
jgi:tetratricopeptide (TPR) repeat protein